MFDKSLDTIIDIADLEKALLDADYEINKDYWEDKHIGWQVYAPGFTSVYIDDPYEPMRTHAEAVLAAYVHYLLSNEGKSL